MRAGAFSPRVGADARSGWRDDAFGSARIGASDVRIDHYARARRGDAVLVPDMKVPTAQHIVTWCDEAAPMPHKGRRSNDR
jgi:hypothetical protein